MEGKRICQIIKLPSGNVQEYVRLHQNVPQGVLDNLRKYNIHDYSIHHAPDLNLLIAHMRYTGTDLQADSQKMREDPVNQQWWSMTDPLQKTLVEGSTGSTDARGWWMNLDEVFYFEK